MDQHQRTYTIVRAAYPKQLQKWTQAPEPLWYSGNLALLETPMVSVVGSRDPTPTGLARTRKLTRLLCEKGICIVSGLAEGVDAAAHQTALMLGGKTIAVMGTPIDECYPPSNAKLKAEIEELGLVLSQFSPGTPIQKSNFPQRNATMAALSLITVVIEAKTNSGTRHQVRNAIALGHGVGFLASLARQHIPWVDEAIQSGVAFVIATPKDLEVQLRNYVFEKPNAVIAHSEQPSLFSENLSPQPPIPVASIPADRAIHTPACAPTTPQAERTKRPARLRPLVWAKKAFNVAMRIFTKRDKHGSLPKQ